MWMLENLTIKKGHKYIPDKRLRDLCGMPQMTVLTCRSVNRATAGHS